MWKRYIVKTLTKESQYSNTDIKVDFNAVLLIGIKRDIT